MLSIRVQVQHSRMPLPWHLYSQGHQVVGQGIAGSDQKMPTEVLDIYDLVAGLLGYTIHNVIQGKNLSNFT